MAKASVRFGVLGPLEVSVGGVALHLGGAKPRLVLAQLLMNAGRVVPSDRLVDALWGEQAGERALSTLQVHVSNLRRALEPAAAALGRDPIETLPHGYRLRPEPGTVDLTELQDVLAAVSGGGLDPDLAERTLTGALDLFRGDPLEDLDDEPSLQLVIQRARRLRHQAVLAHLHASLRLGRHHELLPRITELVSRDQLDEHLRAIQMLALYRSGRQADALAAYQDCRRRLVEELGVEPGPELAGLERRILRHDPDLAAVERDAAREDPVGETVLRSATTSAPSCLVLPDGRPVALDRSTTTIGRLPDRHIVLNDPDVSRMHAEIRRDTHGYILVDAGSTNGCRVNGTRVIQHRLTDGDEIRIGGVLLRFEAMGDSLQARR